MEPTSQHDPRGDPAAARNGDGPAKSAPMEEQGQERHVTSTPVPREPAPLFPDDNRDSVPNDADGNGHGDGDGSEISPTITSPPYWMTRAPPREEWNVSVEDLPGFITLQDNEREDGPGGSNVHGRDRNRACWARSVQVRDHVLVNGSPTNIGAFVVWNIRVETLNVRVCGRPFPAPRDASTWLANLRTRDHI